MGTGKDLWTQLETLTNKHDSGDVASLFAKDAIYIEPGGRHEAREAIAALGEQAENSFPDGT